MEPVYKPQYKIKSLNKALYPLSPNKQVRVFPEELFNNLFIGTVV